MGRCKRGRREGGNTGTFRTLPRAGIAGRPNRLGGPGCCGILAKREDAEEFDGLDGAAEFVVVVDVDVGIRLLETDREPLDIGREPLETGTERLGERNEPLNEGIGLLETVSESLKECKEAVE